MTHLKFMSPEWIKDFNSKSFETRLDIFKEFTIWQCRWYFTTPIDMTSEDQIKFRQACRSLLPPPVMNVEHTPSIDTSEEGLWNV